MNYSNWMSSLKDEVRIRDVIVPGSHNSGCRKIAEIANCQDSDLCRQFEMGLRYFDIRLDTKKKTGNIVFSHNIILGQPIEEDLRRLAEVMAENPSEFCVIVIRRYGEATYGPHVHNCIVDPQKVDDILARTLNPAEYALTDYDSSVTMGDIRKSGKRFILFNETCEYSYTVGDCLDSSWSSKLHGKSAEDFTNEFTQVFDKYTADKFFVFETQLTGGPGTATWFRSPRKNDIATRKNYDRILGKIRENPLYLSKANIIAGDYMAEDDFKPRRILALNIDKGNVKSECMDEFEQMISK